MAIILAGLADIDVSVPLRGKEGAGHAVRYVQQARDRVSVPLRGKEGAGPFNGSIDTRPYVEFPSPCGVRRVRDEG